MDNNDGQKTTIDKDPFTSERDELEFLRSKVKELQSALVIAGNTEEKKEVTVPHESGAWTPTSSSARSPLSPGSALENTINLVTYFQENGQLTVEAEERRRRAVDTRGQKKMSIHLPKFRQQSDGLRLIDAADYLYMLGASDSELLSELVGVTKNASAVWLQAGAQQVVTYPAWRKIFRTWCRPDTTDALRTKALAIKQNSKESGVEYLSHKLEALARAGGLPEEVCVALAIEGLQPYLQMDIRKAPPTPTRTVDLLERVQQLETAYEAYRRQKGTAPVIEAAILSMNADTA